jgi:hypothetical protein
MTENGMNQEKDIVNALLVIPVYAHNSLKFLFISSWQNF